MTGTGVKRAKTLSLDASTVDYVQATKGDHSTSDRVNDLLRRAILDEQYDRLGREAAEFFAHVGEEEKEESAAFQSASLKRLARD